MATSEKGLIEVQDVVLWPVNVKSAPKLRERLLALKSEAIVSLKIDGTNTVWERMRDGKDGRPVNGLKPCDSRTREFWRALFRDRRGELITIAEIK